MQCIICFSSHVAKNESRDGSLGSGTDYTSAAVSIPASHQTANQQTVSIQTQIQEKYTVKTWLTTGQKIPQRSG